jgi:3-phenylpropionate/cinnamic acid dioxygenase small subunit
MEEVVQGEVGELLAIQELAQRTALFLDGEDFGRWLSMFAPEGVYELCAYSNELRRNTVWWRAGRSLLEKQLNEVKDHVRDPATRLHVVSPPIVTFQGDERALARSTFALYRTTPEGQTSLYIAGVYEDKLVRRPGGWLYAEHRANVHTRVLDMFTHVPI